MQTIQWSDFKKLTAEEIRDIGCLKVMFNGIPFLHVVVGAQGGMIAQIEGRMSQIEGIRPPKPYMEEASDIASVANGGELVGAFSADG